jgi:hypothetical protein
MGVTQRLGTIPLAIFTDASNNIGIGGSPSGSYKFEVTGTGNFTGALTGAGATFSGLLVSNTSDAYPEFRTSAADADVLLGFSNTGDGNNGWGIGRRNTGEFWIANYTGNFLGGTRTVPFQLASTGAATFSSTAQNAFLINSTNTDGPILQIQNSGNNLGLIGNAEGITNGGATNFAIRATNNLIFSTGGANPRMTITSGGEVRISSRNLAVTNNVSNEIGVWVKGIGTHTTGYASIQSFASDVTYDTYLALQENGGFVSIGTSSKTGRRLYVLGTGNTSASFCATFDNSGGTTLLGLRNDGYIQSPTTYNNTTANAANVSISSSGYFERSTSSIRFKTNVEDLTIDTTSILSKMRPIWYRSLGQTDRKDWSWYGFIAEELAIVEPRLVHWGYDESSFEKIEITDEEGNIKEETKLKEDAQLIPDGVQYERITVLLVAELQKQNKIIQELSAKVSALENKS